MKQAVRYGGLTLALAGVLALTGCGGDSNTGTQAAFDTAKEVHAISREDGSGTRGAFVELLGIEVKKNGKKVDRTTAKAQITNSTNVMKTQVANDEYALGYISLGSLNDTVKALDIDGVQATAGNIANGTYKLARPFHVVVSKTQALSAESEDFLAFIHSKEGQKIVSDNGYILVDINAKEYSPINASGKLVVAGSSSATPVMEKLAEAYNKYNPDLKMEVQQSDSTTGIQAAMNGTADLGMASRDLKDRERDKVTADVIARDGLAVIVNLKNSLAGMKADTARDFYIGTLTKWNEAK